MVATADVIFKAIAAARGVVCQVICDLWAEAVVLHNNGQEMKRQMGLDSVEAIAKRSCETINFF